MSQFFRFAVLRGRLRLGRPGVVRYVAICECRGVAVKANHWWGVRLWRRIRSVPNVLRDITHAEVDDVVVVADIVIPNHRIGNVIASYP